MFKKALSLTVIVCFFLTSLSPLPQAHADSVLDLPAVGTMVNLSPAYEPVIIKGLTVHKDNPFLFDFIVDVGQDKISGEPLKKEGEKLIKYFLASLAIPDKDVWVNLSPYERNKMIPEALGQTEMGRDLLEQDYILKQITASLIYPEKQLGKTFWNKVYSKAQEMYGTSEIPVNTFNKVWITADRAEVFEHDQTAFVVDSHLKVMLEEDYLALKKHSVLASLAPRNDIHSIGAKIVREIILPELEKEVNTGKHFANLRQIFNSIILSSWYKKNLQQALLNQVYADQNKVKGILLNDPTVKQQIYERYLKAYKKGVFNFIKEDIKADGETVPRKYFSGGMDEGMAAPGNLKVTTDMVMGAQELASSMPDRAMMDMTAGMQMNRAGISDTAMSSEQTLSKVKDPLLERFPLPWVSSSLKTLAFDLELALMGRPAEVNKHTLAIWHNALPQKQSGIGMLLLLRNTVVNEMDRYLIDSGVTGVKFSEMLTRGPEHVALDAPVTMSWEGDFAYRQRVLGTLRAWALSKLQVITDAAMKSERKENDFGKNVAMDIDGQWTSMHFYAQTMSFARARITFPQGKERSEVHTVRMGKNDYFIQPVELPGPVYIGDYMTEAYGLIFGTHNGKFILHNSGRAPSAIEYEIAGRSGRLGTDETERTPIENGDIIHVRFAGQEMVLRYGDGSLFLQEAYRLGPDDRVIFKDSQQKDIFQLSGRSLDAVGVMDMSGGQTELFYQPLKDEAQLSSRATEYLHTLQPGDLFWHSDLAESIKALKAMDDLDSNGHYWQAIGDIRSNLRPFKLSETSLHRFEDAINLALTHVRAAEQRGSFNPYGYFPPLIHKALITGRILSFLPGPKTAEISLAGIKVTFVSRTEELKIDPAVVEAVRELRDEMRRHKAKVNEEFIKNKFFEAAFTEGGWGNVLTLLKKFVILIRSDWGNPESFTQHPREIKALIGVDAAMVSTPAAGELMQDEMFMRAETMINQLMFPQVKLFADSLTTGELKQQSLNLLNVVRVGGARVLAEYISQENINFEDPETRKTIKDLMFTIRDSLFSDQHKARPWAAFHKELDALERTRQLLYEGVEQNDRGEREELVGSAREALSSIKNTQARDLREFLKNNPSLSENWDHIGRALTEIGGNIHQVHRNALRRARSTDQAMIQSAPEAVSSNLGVEELRSELAAELQRYPSRRPLTIFYNDRELYVNRHIMPKKFASNIILALEVKAKANLLQNFIYKVDRDARGSIEIHIMDDMNGFGDFTRGGIDLNTANGMQWKISKDGRGVEMNIDPAMIARIKRQGIESLSPVIFKITPIISIWPLVGLQKS